MSGYDRWLEGPGVDAPEPQDCFDCDGSGWVDPETGDAVEEDDENAVPCMTCKGAGTVEPESDEDIAERKAEARFDQLRDEGRI